MALLTRNAMRSFMECRGKYYEIGEGFTEFTEEKNPIEYARQYIHETTERTDLVGFSSSISYAFDIYDEDVVHLSLLSMMLSENVSSDAVVTVATAFSIGEHSSGKLTAVRRKYTVCPSKLGSGTEALICSGTLKACSPPELGEFDVSTLTFTKK